MSDEPLIPTVLLPVWTVAGVNELLTEGVPGAFDVLNSPQCGLFLPLFTTEEKAQQFIEKSKLEDRLAHRLDSVKLLVSLCLTFTRQGVKHVGIDCPALGQSSQGPVWYHSLAYFIAGIQKP